MVHPRNHRPHIRSEKPLNAMKNHIDAMTEENIEQFLEFQQQEKYSAETLKIHRRITRYLYSFLPEGKRLYKGVLEEWQESLITNGYAPATINSFIFPANGYMEFIGHQEYQLLTRLKNNTKYDSSELSREEYLQLLRTARKQGKEYLYLVIKVIGSTGCTTTELVFLTVKDVQKDRMLVFRDGAPKYIKLSSGLRQELLNYVARSDISSGRIFRKADGSASKRTHVTPYITRLCAAAGLLESKGTVSCIQEMYQATRVRIENGISPTIEQRHKHLIEQEQLKIGWAQA